MIKTLVLIISLISIISSQASTTVRLPLKAVPESLDIDNLIQVDQSRVAKILADTLFEIGDNFELIPKLAQSVSWSKDKLTLSIKLKNLRFSDGTTLDSGVVAKSLNDCLRGSVKNNLLAFHQIKGFSKFKVNTKKSIEGIKVKSKAEIEIKFTQKAPLIFDNLSQQACSIVKYTEGNRDLLRGAFGLGPYKIKAFNKNEIVLSKNKDYYLFSESSPDEVVFRSIEKFGDFKLSENQFDLILTENQQDYSKAFQSYQFSNLSFYNLTFNTQHPNLKDKEIRKAISLGIEFSDLQKNLNWDASRMQSGLFPFGMRGFKKRNFSEKDITEAIKILNKHNYTKKNPLSLHILMGESSVSDLESKLWQTLFKRVPITVQVEVVNNKELMKRREKSDYQILRIGKVPGSLDPHLLLASYISTSKFNTARSKLPACDKLIQSSFDVDDINERFLAYSKAEKCLLDNFILVPLASSPSGQVHVRKPWRLQRTNQYLLYPYSVNEWLSK